MATARHLRALILIIVFAMGCSRKLQGDHSTISIRAPESASHFGKSELQSLATIPADRKACYGVSVTGPGIAGTVATNCSPKSGVVGGFVESGGLLEVDVPRGTERQVDLYLFLMKPGETGPCPQMAGAFSAAQLMQTYFLGKAEHVSLSKDVETVSIQADFPGPASTLAVQLGLPAVCTAGQTPAQNPAGYHVSASFLTTADGGGNYKLTGRVGNAVSGQTLNGPNYILRIK